MIKNQQSDCVRLTDMLLHMFHATTYQNSGIRYNSRLYALVFATFDEVEKDVDNYPHTRTRAIDVVTQHHYESANVTEGEGFVDYESREVVSIC